MVDWHLYQISSLIYNVIIKKQIPVSAWNHFSTACFQKFKRFHKIFTPWLTELYISNTFLLIVFNIVFIFYMLRGFKGLFKK